MPRPLLVIQLFLRSSRVQKKRAVLTIAAIAWGSLSLLLLLSFGEGLKRQMERTDAGLGREIAILWGGETTRPAKGMPSGRAIRPRIEDVELLRGRVQHLAAVSGEISSWRTAFDFGGRTVNGRTTGVSLVYGEIRNHIARPGGRFLNALDESYRRRSVFLGQDLARDIFDDVEPVGRTLLINGVPYTVVGVSIEKQQMSTYGGPDKDHAVIPLRTFEAQFGSDRLSRLVVKAERPELMDAVLRGVRETLAAKYAFDPDDLRAVSVWDTVEGDKLQAKIMLGIQIFLGVMGALTLIVGGIGVANIMYAVVKERTREIGVKMALGARPGWITGPLVLEGLTYTVLGGVVGFVMATGLIVLLELLPTEGNEALQMLGKPTLSPVIGAVNALVLGAIGLAAGYFPARRAASVDPVETLRHE